jgi:hypothetical protein
VDKKKTPTAQQYKLYASIANLWRHYKDMQVLVLVLSSPPHSQTTRKPLFFSTSTRKPLIFSTSLANLTRKPLFFPI